MDWEEQRRYLEAAMARVCPTESVLLEFYQQKTTSSESASIREHLKACQACRDLLEDLADFHDPAGAAEPSPQVHLNAEYEQLWRRIAVDRPPFWRRLTEWFTVPAAQPAVTLAGVLLVVAGGLGIQTFSLNRRLAAERSTWAAELGDREAKLRDLRKQAQSRADWAPPKLNATLVDLFPSSTAVRGGVATESVVTLRVSASQPIVLLLNANSTPSFPGYSLDLLDSQGRVLFHGDNLERKEGNFLVSLPAGFPSPGRYELRLSGRTASESTTAARYFVDYNPIP